MKAVQSTKNSTFHLHIKDIDIPIAFMIYQICQGNKHTSGTDCISGTVFCNIAGKHPR